MLTRFLDKWRVFFFEPISPAAIGLYRILFGWLVLLTLLDIGQKFLVWYGHNGILDFELMKLACWNGEGHFDLLSLCPNDLCLQIYFGSLIISALALMVGLCTTFSAGYTAMGLISLYNHNPYIFHGGDHMVMLICIFLTFSAAGEIYSLDRWLLEKKWNSKFPKPCSPWGQRMVQLQLAIVYFGAFWFKIGESNWLDGTAVYYCTRFPDLMHNSLPLLDQMWFCRICTWGTLALEFAGFTLIWFKPLRYYVLAGLFLMHAGIDYVFNLPIFQWLFLCTLITFIEPDIIATAVQKGLQFVGSVFSSKLPQDHVQSEQIETRSRSLSPN